MQENQGKEMDLHQIELLEFEHQHNHTTQKLQYMKNFMYKLQTDNYYFIC